MEGKKDFPFGRSTDDMTYDLRTHVINGLFVGGHDSQLGLWVTINFGSENVI